MRVWDRRHLSAPLFDFRPHDKPIIRVEWAPYKKGKSSLLYVLNLSSC